MSYIITIASIQSLITIHFQDICILKKVLAYCPLAFSKSTKFAQTGVFHSWHCFLICRSVKIWSLQDLPFRKPAYSLCISGSMAVEILSRITLLKTVLVTDSRVIPLQLMHIPRSPFFGNLTISPVFQSLGISSSSHIPSKISIKVLTMISPPAFNISALTPPSPGAFPGGTDCFPHFFSKWWACVDLQVFVAYWCVC